MSVIVENLVKLYGTQYAVDNISFQVKKGEILGFLGPNGAGKSTTMKLLTGYVPPTSGVIKIGGYDVTTQAQEIRQRIGYLAENNPLYYDMYVKEFLAFSAKIHQIQSASTAINTLIEQVGLGNEQHKKIGQLSKGYKQRVGLAQALLHNPDVLILDEPTSGLDPNQLADIRQLIKELGKEKTVIFSTHIMQEVQAICDNVVIINKGKIVAQNTIEALKAQSNHQTIITVTFEKPIEISHFTTIDGVVDVNANADNTVFHISGNNELQLKKAVFEIAVAQQNSILNLSQKIESLEDIFRQLTQTTA